MGFLSMTLFRTYAVYGRIAAHHLAKSSSNIY